MEVGLLLAIVAAVLIALAVFVPRDRQRQRAARLDRAIEIRREAEMRSARGDHLT